MSVGRLQRNPHTGECENIWGSSTYHAPMEGKLCDSCIFNSNKNICTIPDPKRTYEYRTGKTTFGVDGYHRACRGWKEALRGEE